MADEILSLDAIAEAKDVDYVVVPVPEWGGSLRLGSVSGESKALFLEMYEQDPSSVVREDALWDLLAQCLVDGDGNRLVKTNEDRRRVIATFKRKDARVTDRIFDAMFELLGFRSSKGLPSKNGSGEEASASSPIPLPEVAVS